MAIGEEMEIISYMMSDKSLLFEEDYSRGPADGVKQTGDFILHSDIVNMEGMGILEAGNRGYIIGLAFCILAE